MFVNNLSKNMKNGHPLVSLIFTSGLGKPHKKIANLRKIWCRILYIEKISLFLSNESLNYYMDQMEAKIYIWVKPKKQLNPNQTYIWVKPKKQINPNQIFPYQIERDAVELEIYTTP